MDDPNGNIDDSERPVTDAEPENLSIPTAAEDPALVSPRNRSLFGPEGYEPKLFVDDVEREFICSLCSGVLRSAVVINNDPCGNVFCDACLRARLAQAPECPHDHHPVRMEDVIPVAFANRNIQRKQVRCHIAPLMCAATGELGVGEQFWRAHEAVCQYLKVPCERCHAHVRRRDRIRHEHHECAHRRVACWACGQRDVVASELQQHLQICPRQLEINRIRDGLSDLVERTQELTLEVKNTNQMLEESESQRHAHAAAVAETMRQMDEERKADNERADEALRQAESDRQIDTARVEGALKKLNADAQDLARTTTNTAAALATTENARREEASRVTELFNQMNADRQAETDRVNEALNKALNERKFARARLDDKIERSERQCVETISKTQVVLAEQREDAVKRLFVMREDMEVKLHDELTAAQRRTDSQLAAQEKERQDDSTILHASLERANEALAASESDRVAEYNRLTALIRQQDDEQKAETAEMKNDIKEGAEALRASIIERKADADRFAQALNQSEMLRQADADKLSAALQQAEAERKVDSDKVSDTLRVQNEQHGQEAQELKVRLTHLAESITETELARKQDNDRLNEQIMKQSMARKQDTQELQFDLKRLAEGVRQADHNRRAESERLQALHAQAELERKSEAKSWDEQLRKIEIDRQNDADAYEEQLERLEASRRVEMQEQVVKVQRQIEIAHKLESARQLDMNDMVASLSQAEAKRAQDVAHLNDILQNSIAEREKITSKKSGELASLRFDVQQAVENVKAAEVQRKTDADRISKAFTAAELDRQGADREYRDKRERMESTLKAQEAEFRHKVAEMETDMKRATDSVQKAENERRTDAQRVIANITKLDAARKLDAEKAAIHLQEANDARQAEADRLNELLRQQDKILHDETDSVRAEIKKLAEALHASEVERKREAAHAAELLKKRDAEYSADTRRLQLEINRITELLRAEEDERKNLEVSLARETEARKADADRYAASIKKAEQDLRELERLFQPLYTRLENEARATSAAEAAEQRRQALLAEMGPQAAAALGGAGPSPHLGATARTAAGGMSNRDALPSIASASSSASAQLPRASSRPNSSSSEDSSSSAAAAGVTSRGSSAGGSARSSSSSSSTAGITTKAEGDDVSDDAYFHPGQFRKHRLLEYWSCCQTPSTGKKDVRGCQLKPAGGSNGGGPMDTTAGPIAP